MHKYTKNELNRLKNNAVIGADVHTRFISLHSFISNENCIAHVLKISFE